VFPKIASRQTYSKIRKHRQRRCDAQRPRQADRIRFADVSACCYVNSDGKYRHAESCLWLCAYVMVMNLR